MKNAESPSGDADFERPKRANVIAAKTRAHRALRLIQDEDFNQKLHDWRWEDYAVEYGACDFFFQERMKFRRLPSIGSLYIFPDVFYFP